MTCPLFRERFIALFAQTALFGSIFSFAFLGFSVSTYSFFLKAPSSIPGGYYCAPNFFYFFSQVFVLSFPEFLELIFSMTYLTQKNDLWTHLWNFNFMNIY